MNFWTFGAFLILFTEMFLSMTYPLAESRVSSIVFMLAFCSDHPARMQRMQRMQRSENCVFLPGC